MTNIYDKSISCAIIQSSYIPWRGYFDLIHQADVFVFLDQVQFTRRDWRTRNRIITANGPTWLSVPVRVRDVFNTSIFDVLLDNSQNWNTTHLKSIKLAYSKARFFQEIIAILEPFYLNPPEKLVELNRQLTQALWNSFSGNCPKQFVADEELSLGEIKDSNERLISICQKVGANIYYSGPSARDYLRLEQWRERGIEVRFMEYNYLNYPQLYGEFEPGVSVIDTLMNLGPGCISTALS